MEELQARHRKEQKDLQSRITQKKKSATKKTRKGINDECDRLQRELREKQQTEIAQLNGEDIPGIEALTIQDEGNDDIERDVKDEDAKGGKQSTAAAADGAAAATAEPPRAKKGNRQKARLARRAAEREAEAEKAAEEAGNQTDHRANERKAMDEVFKRFNLREKDIAPDGHCLYSSVAFQLVEIGAGLKPLSEKGEESAAIEKAGSIKNDGYRFVRTATADFIMAHPDDFSPFLEEPLQEYVRKIRLTSEWGGQLELQAISRAYGVRINVIQGDGRIEKFEPEGEEGVKEIWLAYYRHTYGLGEHYNALTRVV